MTAEEFVQLLDETKWMGHELVRGDALQVGEPWVELKHARRSARLVQIFWNFEVTNRIRSSTDRADTLPAKIDDFLTAGTKQFWLLDEDERTVTIHTADAEPRIVRGSEPLTADPVLPGISCTLDQLFS